jgi:hypothetical protein
LAEIANCLRLQAQLARSSIDGELNNKYCNDLCAAIDYYDQAKVSDV